MTGVEVMRLNSVWGGSLHTELGCSFRTKIDSAKYTQSRTVRVWSVVCGGSEGHLWRCPLNLWKASFVHILGN